MNASSPIDRMLALVTKTLDDMEDPNTSVSVITRRAVRIARIRNDYSNLLWLQFELLSMHEKEARFRLAAEIAPHISKEEYKILSFQTLEAFAEERRTISSAELTGSQVKKDNKNILAMSVAEIEARRAMFIELRNREQSIGGLHPTDAYFIDREVSQARLIASTAIRETDAILSRIRNRVHDYLSSVEKDLVYGRLQSDVFERNRRYVESRLSEVVPEIAEQMRTAEARLDDSNPESYSQALTTCRRALKAIADHVFPATNESIQGSDGRIRTMSEDKYIARLWQFAHKSLGNSAGGKLVLSQLDDLGHRIDAIYKMSSKGVHATVDRVEAERCFVQTYLLLGEILRIQDGQIAIPKTDASLEIHDDT
jgi:hypothetical protein